MSITLRDFRGLVLVERNGRLVCEIEPDESRSASDERRLEAAHVEVSRALGWHRSSLLMRTIRQPLSS